MRNAAMYVMARDQVAPEQLVPIAYHMLRQWREHLCVRQTHQLWGSLPRIEDIPVLDFVRDRSPASGPEGDPITELMELMPGGYRDPEAVWIRVSMDGLVYNEHYRHGDGSAHVAIAEWLECALPGATIFYGWKGADELELFDRARRQELLADFIQANEREKGTGPDCRLCRFPMHDFHEGEERDEEEERHPERRFGTYYCEGCGALLSLPGAVTNPDPEGFRDTIVDVLPWAVLHHPELLDVIFETPLYYWSNVSKDDFARWLSHPRHEVRQAAIRLKKGEE